MIQGIGEMPWAVTEIDLIDRFGWTFTELDGQDMGRVLPGLALANTRDALRRVMSWLNSNGRGPKPTDNDWKIYRFAAEMNADGDSS